MLEDRKKRAAIEVVKDRLHKVGLGPFCLDLHAHDATKLEFIQALAEPLDLPRTAAPADLARKTAELSKVKDELAGTWRALHLPGAAGVSVWQAVTRLGDLGSEPHVRFDFGKQRSVASRPLNRTPAARSTTPAGTPCARPRASSPGPPLPSAAPPPIRSPARASSTGTRAARRRSPTPSRP